MRAPALIRPKIFPALAGGKGWKNGLIERYAGRESRTPDLRFTKPLLYQLSYTGKALLMRERMIESRPKQGKASTGFRYLLQSKKRFPYEESGRYRCEIHWVASSGFPTIVSVTRN